MAGQVSENRLKVLEQRVRELSGNLGASTKRALTNADLSEVNRRIAQASSSANSAVANIASIESRIGGFAQQVQTINAALAALKSLTDEMTAKINKAQQDLVGSIDTLNNIANKVDNNESSSAKLVESVDAMQEVIDGINSTISAFGDRITAVETKLSGSVSGITSTDAAGVSPTSAEFNALRNDVVNISNVLSGILS